MKKSFNGKGVKGVKKQGGGEKEKAQSGNGKRKADGDKGGRPTKKRKVLVKQPKVPVVYCKDLNSFTEEIIKLRKLPNHESLLMKFGVDDGQSFLKVTFSIIHLLAHTQQVKRTFRDRLLDSGTGQIFIVGVTPSKETHHNLLTLLELLHLQSFSYPFQIAADLKAMAALVGLSSAGTACCPCPICIWRRSDGAKGGAEMRTCRMVTEDYEKWMRETGGKTTLNKNYHNINHLPLPIFNDPNMQIADLFSFPTVHMHTGIFNHIFDNALQKHFPGIMEWPRILCLKKKGYHGWVFEVNK